MVGELQSSINLQTKLLQLCNYPQLSKLYETRIKRILIGFSAGSLMGLAELQHRHEFR